MNGVSRLPDAFAKTPDSNNAKLIGLSSAAIDTFRNDMQSVYDAFGMDTASGLMLDKLGEEIGQPRGSSTDAQYRVLLKAKINRNMCTGTFDSVLQCIAYTFTDGDTSGITLTEGEMSVDLVNLPLADIVKYGFTGSQALAIFKSLMPIGISFFGIADGTFSFSADNAAASDRDAGFADNEQTTGGYFGMLLADDSSDLPL